MGWSFYIVVGGLEEVGVDVIDEDVEEVVFCAADDEGRGVLLEGEDVCEKFGWCCWGEDEWLRGHCWDEDGKL